MRNGRAVVISSKHKEFLEAIRGAIGSRGGICQQTSGFGSIGYKLQISSRSLWARSYHLGLTPHKSLTIGPLKIPDAWFRDFLRGVIDGDGNIRCWVHSTNGREQWTVRIVGCSRPFLLWLQQMIERLWGVQGAMHTEPASCTRRHAKHTLKFGKLAAKALLSECYYRGALALTRKAHLAEACIAAKVGWRKSLTVSDKTRWLVWKYEHNYPVSAGNGGIRRGVGTGRRYGLKTRCPERDVWVRLPPPAVFLRPQQVRRPWAVSSVG